MKTLVIAEKPKVQQTFAAAVKTFESVIKKGRNYYSEHYEIHALSGHLFELYSVEEYEPNYKKSEKHYWKWDNLPCCPENFMFKLKDKTRGGANPKDIFNGIVDAIERCDQIIHLGDSDGEGQYLVDLVLRFANNKKPVFRLWQDSNTVEEIFEKMKQLKPNDSEEFQKLTREGYIRQYQDWLVGINGSRFCTLKFGRPGMTMRYGRVITAIVSEIYQRDMAIKNFKPETYFQPTSEGAFQLQSKHKFGITETNDINDAKALCNMLYDKYNAAGSFVTKVVSKDVEIKARKLFSSSKLQGAMSKEFKYSPDVTLATLQKLYEEGYVTYPRTDSEYLKTEETSKVKQAINGISNAFQGELTFKNSSTIFNNKKVEGHSAIIPTGFYKPLIDERQKNLYQTIVNRFMAVFCKEPCIVKRSKVDIRCLDEDFQVTGDVYKSIGWKKYEKSTTKDNILPEVSVGQKLDIVFKPKEKQTTPPKHYTTTSLMAFLDNPFQKEEHEDDDSYYQNIRSGATIGKSSTRASIIENACNNGYISYKNDTYKIEPTGIYFIETLHKLNIDLTKEKTVEMGVIQRKVGNNEMNMRDALKITENEVYQMFEGKDIEIARIGQESFGKCPICGEDIIETKKCFMCKNKDFLLMKQDKFFKSLHKTITANVAKDLILRGQTTLNGLTSKKGNKYSLIIKLKKDQNGNLDTSNKPFMKYETEFPQTRRR